MPSTYTPIATTTLGSAVASYTFSSISGAYTDLVLIVNGISTATNNLTIQVGNGSVDTGTNYSNTFMYGDGSSAVSGRDTGQSKAYVGRVLVNPTPNIICLNNYSNTTTYKTILSKGGQDIAVAGVNLWRSTAAINTIKVFPEVNNFSVGSVLTLYGIASA